VDEIHLGANNKKKKDSSNSTIRRNERS